MSNTMMRCHFDGKVFVPEEPVNLQPCAVVNVPALGAGVFFTGGPGGTMGDLEQPLHTFNQKHVDGVPGLRTVQPYTR
jgi:hypothetical protein